MTENATKTQICPHCGATNIGIQTVCLKCGKTLAIETPSFAPPQDDRTVLEKPDPIDVRTVKEVEPIQKALLFESKGGLGMQYVLADGFTLGRGGNNNVVIDSTKASRSHARIDRTSLGNWQLSDLGSTNGTFLNGKRLDSPAELKDGDIIRIGEVEFTLKLEQPRKAEVKKTQAVPPPPVSQIPPPDSKPISTPAHTTPKQAKSASSTKTLVMVGGGLLLLVICLCVGALLIYNFVIR